MAKFTDLNVGDRVILSKNMSSAAKIGAAATITGKDSLWGWIRLKWDRNGLDNNQQDGNYTPDYFDKIETDKAEYIIALKKNGKYLPATMPRTYPTESQAHAVALSMSEKHGGEFVVFKTTASFEVPPAPKAVKKVFA